MVDLDFQYDNLYLSDFGFVVCSFDNSSGDNTISEGSEITFDLTPVSMGANYLLAGAKYDGAVTAEFDICKIPKCKINDAFDDDFYVSYDEERDISRWLNRKEMLPFMLISDHYEGVRFDGSFNISKYEYGGNVVGFHLKFFSNKPFGYLDTYYKFSISQANGEKTIYDYSDEIGYSLVDMEVTVKQAGDLKITNTFDGKEIIVRNCVQNEKIQFTSSQQIISSDNNHANTIMNDFNFIFPIISNSFKNRKNTFIFSLPSDVVIKYKQIRKVGV